MQVVVNKIVETRAGTGCVSTKLRNYLTPFKTMEKIEREKGLQIAKYYKSR